MRFDIILRQGNQVLIIDVKYYTHTTQLQYDTHKLHSANLYQIFTFIKNTEYELIGTQHRASVCDFMPERMKKHCPITHVL